ncbi:MAG: hypothetical protein M1826_007645 [Phylliscum demangeonii]|nr:MAG: hypothetical protein M1826_007645 [Phylliscum demangeonii]
MVGLVRKLVTTKQLPADLRRWTLEHLALLNVVYHDASETSTHNGSSGAVTCSLCAHLGTVDPERHYRMMVTPLVPWLQCKHDYVSELLWITIESMKDANGNALFELQRRPSLVINTAEREVKLRLEFLVRAADTSTPVVGYANPNREWYKGINGFQYRNRKPNASQDPVHQMGMLAAMAQAAAGDGGNTEHAHRSILFTPTSPDYKGYQVQVATVSRDWLHYLRHGRRSASFHIRTFQLSARDPDHFLMGLRDVLQVHQTHPSTTTSRKRTLGGGGGDGGSIVHNARLMLGLPARNPVFFEHGAVQADAFQLQAVGRDAALDTC